MIFGAEFAREVIAKAGSVAVLLPSLTLMVMFEKVPATVGVPVSVPLHLSKLAQLGWLAILYTSGSPFASAAVGLKEYVLPIVAEVEGEPEMVGATFEVDVARIENVDKEDVLTPSLTLIEMEFHKPTALGVPESCPVEELKLAQEGLFAMEYVSVLPSGSAAVGRKLYCEPT